MMNNGHLYIQKLDTFMPENAAEILFDMTQIHGDCVAANDCRTWQDCMDFEWLQQCGYVATSKKPETFDLYPVTDKGWLALPEITRWQQIRYNVPVFLPAGDAGLFPAAHPRPLPAGLEDSYDSFHDFKQEVVRLWSLDECLDYPCQTTLSHAFSLLRGMARDGGYDALLPAYEKFVAVCQDNLMLMAADRLLQDYQPGSDADSRWYGMVKK